MLLFFPKKFQYEGINNGESIYSSTGLQFLQLWVKVPNSFISIIKKIKKRSPKWEGENSELERKLFNFY